MSARKETPKDRVKIIGGYLSPYVRKVLVVLELKSIPYDIDPIVPFYGNDAFSKLSPLRRIPIFIDKDIVLTDSTVICEYLNEKYPNPPLLPASLEDRARSRWLEEFADSRMGDVFIWKLYNNLVIQKAVFGENKNEEAVKSALEVDIPSVLDYLEAQVPKEGFLFGSSLSIGDISIATIFRNAQFVRFKIDSAKWPRTAAYVDRLLASPPFLKLRPYEEAIARVIPPKHRAVLGTMNAPLTAETFTAEKPRKGIMNISKL